MATDDIVLEHLRAIRATQDRHSEDLGELKGRLGIIEQQIGSLTQQYARTALIGSTNASAGSRNGSNLSTADMGAVLD